MMIKSRKYSSGIISNTSMIEPRIYSRTIGPPQRYSLALYKILLTNIGEPKSYNEAIQVDESIKWELAMRTISIIL